MPMRMLMPVRVMIIMIMVIILVVTMTVPHAQTAKRDVNGAADAAENEC